MRKRCISYKGILSVFLSAALMLSGVSPAAAAQAECETVQDIMSIEEVYETETVSENIYEAFELPEEAYADSADETAEDGADEQEEKFTLMLYLCGTNLENRTDASRGLATYVLANVVLGAYEAKYSNAVVLAGGTDVWQNEYMNQLLGTPEEERVEGYVNKSGIFVVNSAGIEKAVKELMEKHYNVSTIDELHTAFNNETSITKRLAAANVLINENTLTLCDGTLGERKMGDPETVKALISYTQENEALRAKYNALSIWNHGGGAVGMFCTPNDGTGGLYITDLAKALDETGYGNTVSGNSCKKLDFLAFDACLMGASEIAAYLNDYYDLMYASEESTFGDIDYYIMQRRVEECIPDEKIDNKDLEKIIAIEILESRGNYYTGTSNMLSTGALFDSVSNNALASLKGFNDVAQLLNKRVSEKGEAVYKAFKIARIKCEQIGIMSVREDCYDYVDMKNFLQMLKAELKTEGVLIAGDELDEAIDRAINLADKATLANVFNYGNKHVFYDYDGKSIWFNKEYWDKIKGMELCGESVYVPYYGAVSYTYDDDGNKVLSNRIEKEINTYNEFYKDALGIADYSEFLSGYKDYMMSPAEKNRISKLKADLDESGYDDIINVVLEDVAAGEMLTVKAEYKDASKISEYSSGNALVDLYETSNSMVVYLTRRAKIEAAASNDGEAEYVNIILYDKHIGDENLNGLNNSVKSLTNQFNCPNVLLVKQTEYSSEAGYAEVEGCVKDLVTVSDIDGYGQKRIIMDQFLGDGADSNKCITVKGSVTVSDGKETKEYVGGIYHLFSRNSDDDFFFYQGSVQFDSEWKLEKVFKKESVQSLTFYHQMVDGKTGRIAYAEEILADDAVAVDGVQRDLFGHREYSCAGNNSVIIEVCDLGQIGELTDSAYYFATSQEKEKIDDDLFYTTGAGSDTYSSSRSIFELISESGNNEPEPEPELILDGREIILPSYMQNSYECLASESGNKSSNQVVSAYNAVTDTAQVVTIFKNGRVRAIRAADIEKGTTGTITIPQNTEIELLGKDYKITAQTEGLAKPYTAKSLKVGKSKADSRDIVTKIRAAADKSFKSKPYSITVENEERSYVINVVPVSIDKSYKKYVLSGCDENEELIIKPVNGAIFSGTWAVDKKNVISAADGKAIKTINYKSGNGKLSATLTVNNAGVIAISNVSGKGVLKLSLNINGKKLTTAVKVRGKKLTDKEQKANEAVLSAVPKLIVSM